METEKLKKYLYVIIDLEKNKYTQEKIIKNLNNKIDSGKQEYNNNIHINERTDIISGIPATSTNIPVNESGKLFMYFMVYYMGFLGMSLGVGVFYLSMQIVPAIVVGIIGAVIGGSIPRIIWKNVLKKRREQTVINMHRNRRTDIELVQSRNKRNEELKVIIPRLVKERDTVEKTYDITCDTLKQYYELNVIPPKYRNIVPVCMFYEYLINGRTYSLVRNPVAFDEGAINMYEDEVFRNVIIHKLDTIINRLDSLGEGQRQIQNAIAEGNRETQRILNNINDNVSKGNDILESIKYQEEQQTKCAQYVAGVVWFNN